MTRCIFKGAKQPLVYFPAAPHASARVTQQNGEDMVDNDISENIIHDKLLNDKLRTNLGYVYELPPYYRMKRVLDAGSLAVGA